MALQYHAQRVADQDGFCARFGHEARKRGVIGGDADEFFSRGLHFVEGADGDLAHALHYPKNVGLK